MNGMLLRKWLVVWMVAIAIVAVGCASTSTIANKATFGLVGGDDDPATAERKAEAREAKQAEKEQKAAEKRAKKEEQGERGILNRATFGMAGGGSDEEKERKAAEKEAEREAEAQRKAERQAAKQERDRLNREANAQRDAEKQAKKAEKSERSLLSRATFGVAGTDSEEERQQKEAEAAAKREEELQRKAEKEAEKEAEREAKSERSLLNKATFGLAGTETEAEREEREAKEAAEEAEREAEKEQKRAENAERSRLNRLTLGLAGTETEEERQEREAKEQAKREEDELRDAEREAEKERERAANAERSRLNRLTLGLAGTETEEEREQREAEEAVKREEKRQAELAKAEENANKTWLNRTTYGVLGEDYNDDALVAMAESDPDSLTPEQLEKAEERKRAIADHQARQNVESFSDPEARRLAGYPFHTDVETRVTPKGNEVSTATTETYSRDDYGIADVGDVRIAVRGQTFKGDPRRSRLVVASSDRGPAQGSLGVGNQQLAYLYERGTTTATFGEVEFSLSDSMLTVGGVTVPVGQGRKLVVLDGGGAAQTYDIDVP